MKKIINFMKIKKWTMAFSIMAIVLTTVSLSTVGFNYGIDFKGGVVTEVFFEKSMKAEDVRAIFIDDFSEITSVRYGSSHNIVLQTPTEGDYKNAGTYIIKKIQNIPEYSNAKIVRSEFIGPKIGDELKTDGLLALLLVTIGVLIYVSIRFEFKFAIGAIFALVHDVFITAGMISIIGIDLDLTVLAALLAILGYSLNDTIVVYDRIRENFEKLNEKTVFEIINISLTETLSRTLMTSLTTAVTLISLFLFSGESLTVFSIVLLFGVVIGTYSSVYVASNILLILDVKKDQFKKEKLNTEEGVV